MSETAEEKPCESHGKACFECGKAVLPPAPPSYPKFDDLGPAALSFEDYFLKQVKKIQDVQTILATALKDDPLQMEAQIREIEKHFGAMKSILGWADSYLDVAEHTALHDLPARSKNYTDTDRVMAVAAAVTRQRRFRDVVRGIVESIDKRISYGQSRLKFIERNHG